MKTSCTDWRIPLNAARPHCVAGAPQQTLWDPSDLAAAFDGAHTGPPRPEMSDPDLKTEAKPMRFERSCLYCGARFEVTAGVLEGEAEPQEYDCPDCGKQYEVVTTGVPQVR